jgi:hypothetical protein
MKKHKRKQNHRDFTFKEQIKFQHLFYGNSKPDNVLCILFVTGHPPLNIEWVLNVCDKGCLISPHDNLFYESLVLYLK